MKFMKMNRRACLLMLAVLSLILSALFAACGSEQPTPTETTASSERPTSAEETTEAEEPTAAEETTTAAEDTTAAEETTAPVITRETETTPLPAEGESYYVALGDSIARGYGVDLKTVSYGENHTRSATFNPNFYRDDGTATFAADTYTARIRDWLLSEGTVDGGYNFARSGDDCGDLLAFLDEFCTEYGTKKDPDKKNSIYGELTNEQIFTIMQNARVVTVCIGANNVLGPALELLPKYMADEVTYEEMEQALYQALAGDGATTGLEAEMKQLLPRLQVLCPDAEIVFTTVYNPYKIMEYGEGMTFLQMLGAIKNADVKLTKIEQLSEICIAGGKLSTGTEVTGINAILETTVKAFAETAGERFRIVDAKASFDAVTEADGGHYCDYVNTDIGLLTAKDAANFATYADPHPTPDGHRALFDVHKALLDTLEPAGE